MFVYYVNRPNTQTKTQKTLFIVWNVTEPVIIKNVLKNIVRKSVRQYVIFPLCRTCAEWRTPKCFHTDEKRCLIGTWATDEVNKAIEKGYVIQKVYEVWHFEKKSDNLLKGYVKDFLKIKLETSK